MAIAVQATRSGADPRAPFEPLGIALDRCKGYSLCVAACPKGTLELDASIVILKGE
jgi:hypothetical protein